MNLYSFKPFDPCETTVTTYGVSNRGNLETGIVPLEVAEEDVLEGMERGPERSGSTGEAGGQKEAGRESHGEGVEQRVHVREQRRNEGEEGKIMDTIEETADGGFGGHDTDIVHVEEGLQVSNAHMEDEGRVDSRESECGSDDEEYEMDIEKNRKRESGRNGKKT